MAVLKALFIFLLSLCYASAITATKRASLIESAVAEVMEKDDWSETQSADRHLSLMQQKFRAFKKSSAEVQAHGRARLRFERMVKMAEKKIIEEERKAIEQDTKELTKSYAQELFHTTGKLLTAQEIYEFFEYSGCTNFNTTIVDFDCNFEDRVWRRNDGTCNNILYPRWGSAGSPMRRLLNAEYEDGISQPRGFFQLEGMGAMKVDREGPPNPNPRIVSTEIVRDEIEVDSDHSMLLMQFGQFMDHDLDFMPEYTNVHCDSCDLSEDDEACTPIPFPPGDQLGIDLDRDCLEFRRSLPVCDSDDSFYTIEARNHINTITHFIDASTVYHHNKEVLDKDMRGPSGTLIMINEPEISNRITQLSLPVMKVAEEAPVLCGSDECPQYLAGDGRANEHLGLTSMHTLWAREHNRIASSPAIDNCDSDTVFNTARHIVTAQIQNIMYNHYLPIILGPRFYKLMGLDVYKGYDRSVNPNIPNAFASAAFRYGHSQVQPTFELRTKITGDPSHEVQLSNAFFNIDKYREFGTDPVFRGFMRQKARKLDEFVTSTLTNQLFTSDENSPGMDLASLNIMRGRDHGIPPYVIWRNWAKRVCFDEINVKPDFRNPETESRLMGIYGSLDTVDLFVGGLAEKSLPGGLVGPTFGCILANTFLAVRDGDRFYFENIFNEDQINEIKRVTFSHTICENTEKNFGKINRDVFMAESPTVECDVLRKETLELDLWDCKDFEPRRRPGNTAENILRLLKNLVNQLESRIPLGSNVEEQADKNSASVMTDNELADKLESLLNKVKK